jgi:hypothetical protein
MMMEKNKYFLISFMLIIIQFAFPANRQFEIKFGYGGYAVPGYWTPLIIKNNQEINNGSVEIERVTPKKDSPKEIYPIGKNSVIECPVLIDELTSGVIVRLYSGNELLMERSVRTDEKIFPGHMILTSGMNSRIQQALTHCLFPEEPVMTTSVNPEELPSTGLNYDCISALVMTDPGNSLTPAQIDSLKYWIAGGVKLVLFGILPDNESIIDKFRDDFRMEDKNSEIIDMGYGKIIAFTKDADSLDFTSNSSKWHDLLEMKPYAHNLRLTSSKAFITDDNPDKLKIDNSFLRTVLFFIVLIWSVIFILILIIVKKKILILTLYTCVAIIALIPSGYVLKKIWHGGAIYHNRMIVLPGNSGVSFDTMIWFPLSTRQIGIQNNYSIWGINADFGVSEKAVINNWFGKISFLFHSLYKPAYSLKKGNSLSIELSSFVSNEALDGSFLQELIEKNKGAFLQINKINFGNNPKLVLVKGNSLDIEWWKWDNVNFKWNRNDAVPDWLSNDMGWMNQLKKIRPDNNWLVGLDRFSGLNLKIQNELCPLTLWAIPVN